MDSFKGVPLTSHWLEEASAMDATTTAGLLRTWTPCMVAVTVYVPAVWAWYVKAHTPARVTPVCTGVVWGPAT